MLTKLTTFNLKIAFWGEAGDAIHWYKTIVMRASLLTSMFDSLISPSTQFAACNAATEALKLKVASFLG